MRKYCRSWNMLQNEKFSCKNRLLAKSENEHSKICQHCANFGKIYRNWPSFAKFAKSQIFGQSWLLPVITSGCARSFSWTLVFVQCQDNLWTTVFACFSTSVFLPQGNARGAPCSGMGYRRLKHELLTKEMFAKLNPCEPASTKKILKIMNERVNKHEIHHCSWQRIRDMPLAQGRKMKWKCGQPATLDHKLDDSRNCLQCCTRT